MIQVSLADWTQRCRTALLCGALLLPLSLRAETFLADLEDLPLPPGLMEAAGGWSFESGSGRIVEALAQGALVASDVRHFYQQSLHQLGWQELEGLQFRRDAETLRILIDDRTQPLTVHFILTPTR